MTATVPLDDVDLVGLDEVLLAESRGIVIDFWGTWCQPCRTLRPLLEQVAAERADGWRFVAVHVESNPELVDRYQVMSTPTLVFVAGGDEVHRLAGAVTPSTIVETLDNLS